MQFIERGGSYIGFCGGAGMALSSAPSLELVPFERMPLAERLPNASGQVWIRGMSNHPAWKSLQEEIPVSIWWPSQFAWQPLPGCLPLSCYTAPGEDFWVADLPLADLNEGRIDWHYWESIYGINLDPKRMLGQPAVFEIRKGKGRLILSYPHLESPGNLLANHLFLNILNYLDGQSSNHLHVSAASDILRGVMGSPPGAEAVRCLQSMRREIDGLIAFGERHLLWYWHFPWLLRWQRGIRGLEYCMLAVTIRFLADLSQNLGGSSSPENDPWLQPLKKLQKDVREFCSQARTLLLEEKLAAHTGSLSKLGKVNASVDQLRSLLFGNKMNHGGICRSIFDDLDYLTLHLLRLADSLA